MYLIHVTCESHYRLISVHHYGHGTAKWDNVTGHSPLTFLITDIRWTSRVCEKIGYELSDI